MPRLRVLPMPPDCLLQVRATHFLEICAQKAKAANTDYCEITKQHFRELEETVQKVTEAADELNSKIGENAPKTAVSRAQTFASIRTLTGSVRSGSADVRRTHPPILFPLGPVTCPLKCMSL